MHTIPFASVKLVLQETDSVEFNIGKETSFWEFRLSMTSDTDVEALNLRNFIKGGYLKFSTGDDGGAVSSSSSSYVLNILNIYINMIKSRL